MASVIQNLLDNTLGDGARSSKFECFINFHVQDFFPNGQDVVALTKTSQFPGKSHEVIDLKFKGRTIPIKGQVKYDNTWTCTFYLTQDHLLKKGFEDWIEALDQQHNLSDTLSQTVKAGQRGHHNLGYATDMKIAQLDFHGSQQTAIYTLYNVFPKSVSAIDVDYSSVGSIMEVTVEFAYSHYDVYVDKTDLSTFADEIKAKGQAISSEIVGSIKNQITGLMENTSTRSMQLFEQASSLFGSSSGVNGPDKMISKVD